MRYHQNSSTYPYMSTMSGSRGQMPTLSDVHRLPEVEISTWKPEVLVSQTWNDISSKFQRLPPHCRPYPTQQAGANITCRSPTTGNGNNHLETGSTCISDMELHIFEIPTPTPTLSTTPDSTGQVPTLPDVHQLPEMEITTWQPEVLVSQTWNDISS